MSELRDIDVRFLDAMEERLGLGRQKSMVGWDQHWKDCYFEYDPDGPRGMFVDLLQRNVRDLIVYLQSNRRTKIRETCADIANFAMFIADIHETLEPPAKEKP